MFARMSRYARAMLVLAMVTAAVIWVFGQAFGMIFTGSGTDPNSGPLLALLAITYWPARDTTTPSPQTARAGEAGGMTA